MGCGASFCTDSTASLEAIDKKPHSAPVLHGKRPRKTSTQPKPSKIARYCFVIRHGQRADQSKQYLEEYKGHPDAFLTAKGHTQATETGKFLSSYLQSIAKREKRPFTKIVVKSSPFIRSMATAARICK